MKTAIRFPVKTPAYSRGVIKLARAMGKSPAWIEAMFRRHNLRGDSNAR